MKRYYLDHNATTPLAPQVSAAMQPYCGGLWGNPSSLHAEGRAARGAIDLARDQLARWLRCKPSELIFTSGGTESNNLAVQGLAWAHARKGRHIITEAGEHHAVLHTCQMLAKRHGFSLTILPTQSDGRVDPAALENAIRPDTTLVSIMSANNETGVRQPVREIGAICAARDVLFHTDAVQSAGKEPIDIAGWNATALSLTAHKMGGPVGAGLLYLKAGTPIERLMEGGSHENERRPGTENVAAIVGLAAAAQLAEQNLPLAQKEFVLIEQLWRELAAIPGIRRNGHPTERVPNTLNVSFSGIKGEDLLIALDLAGLSVSSGSACLVGSVQFSHVLRAMGLDKTSAPATVRFSIGHDLSEQDATSIAAIVRSTVSRLSSNGNFS
jgi:cysteine desulfurase